MNLNIRHAVYEDAARLAQIRTASWRDSFAGILDSNFLASMSVLDAVRGFQRQLTIGDASILVLADQTDTVQGYAVYHRLRDPEPENFGEIYSLFVDFDARGNGDGRRLVEACFSDLKSSGFAGCRIWTLAAAEARFFYQALARDWNGSQSAERTIKIANAGHLEFAYDYRL